MINLSILKSFKHKRVRRVGRGNASGNGTTAGRGTKGQRARTGGKKGLKYKGLRSTLLKLPKFKGMKPKTKKKPHYVAKSKTHLENKGS